MTPQPRPSDEGKIMGTFAALRTSLPLLASFPQCVAHAINTPYAGLGCSSFSAGNFVQSRLWPFLSSPLAQAS